jgi:hypothetical protein
MVLTKGGCHGTNRRTLTHDERVARDLKILEGYSREQLIRFCTNATYGIDLKGRRPEECATEKLRILARVIITS